MLAEECGKLIANHLHNLLVWGELHHDFGADGLGANVGEEFIGHTDVDVALEEGVTNLCEGGVEVLVGQLALAAKILEGALQLFCKVFKHDEFLPLGSSPIVLRRRQIRWLLRQRCECKEVGVKRGRSRV